MRKALAILLLLPILSCTKVYNETPTAPSQSVAPGTPKQPDKIEFRVFGNQISSVVTIKHSDPINGAALYVGGTPYYASVNSKDDSIFLFIEATGNGTFSFSSLQAQIYVNGQLFRESFSQGFALSVQASGTYRRQ